jgi:hypothetical protein
MQLRDLLRGVNGPGVEGGLVIAQRRNELQ